MLCCFDLCKGPFFPVCYIADKQATAQHGTIKLPSEILTWARQTIVLYITL